MAIAGDVLIKLAADFAEFAKGMDESGKKLEDFGKKATETANNIDSFIGQVKKVAGALGLAELGRQAFEYMESLQKSAAELSTQATALGLSTDQLQAYKIAAVDAGTSSDAITTAVTRFNVAIGEANQGSKTQIDALNSLGVKILDANGKLRSQTDIMTEVAAALLKMPEGAQRAQAAVALFGKSGQDLIPILRQLAEGNDYLIQKYRDLGLMLDPDTVEKFDAMQRSAELAQQKINAFIAPFYASAKSTVLGWVADTLDDFKNLVDNFNTGKLEQIATIIALLANPATWTVALEAMRNLREGQTATFEDPKITGAIKATTDAMKELQEVQRGMAQAQQEGFAPRSPRMLQFNKELEQAQKNLADAQAAQDKLMSKRSLETVPTMPAITVSGARNPPPASSSSTSQADEIERQIKRYELLGQAAKNAMKTIEDSRSVPIEDLQRNVRVQQQIDDILAKQGSRTGITDDQKRRLFEAVDASERLRDAVQKRMQAETDADQTERRLGDGTAAMSRAMRDLTKQKDTDRLGTVAYTRAVKEQEEAIANAADAAARWDDNLGSLSAGFDQAARQYARAHDLFSTGQQAFTGIVSLMDDGLDALAGKSSKTFGQIASDFALMLAKMALQAATSSIFKTIFGSLLGATGYVPAVSATTNTIPDIGTLISGLGYGGGKAGGGDVYPGNVYTVGEYGPERFVPSVAGSIQPMGGRMGDVSVNVDMSGGQQRTDPKQAMEMARRLRTAVVDVITNEKRPGGLLHGGAT